MKRSASMNRTGVHLSVALVVGLGFSALAQQTPPPKPVPPPGARDVSAPPAAPAPAGTGAISGTLTAADTGRTLRRARVTLSGGDVRINKSVTTDDRGAFSFTALSAGEFTLSASKGGFLDVVYGQRKPGTGQQGTPIRLTAGQQLQRLALQIPRGGVMTGVILDEAGDPAFGVPVRAMRYVWRTGERTLQQAGSGTTDDRGIYRITSLSPGDYIVSAVPKDAADAEMAMVIEMKMRVEEVAADARMSGNPAMMDQAKNALAKAAAAAADTPDLTSGYAPVYYPSTIQASAAATIALGVSEEKTGVDVQLQVVPLAAVSGSVTAPSGPAGLPMVQVQLVDRTQPSGSSIRSTRASADGTFKFNAVVPGQYTLVARGTVREGPPATGGPDPVGKELAIAAALADMGKGPMAGAQPLWAMADVAVDGRPVSNVGLVLQQGLSISGSVAFEGGAPPTPAQLARASIALVPAATGGAGADVASMPPTPIDANGRFTIRGVVPGAYRVVASAGVPGYSMKSSVFSGRDSLDFPLEVKAGEDQGGGLVTFSTKTSEVSGALQDTSGAPAPGYTVVVFAADVRYWTPQSRRVQATRPGTDGHFTFRGLPPGDYRIVAVTDVEAGQWFDPAFLRQLVGGSIPFPLGEGERKTEDLRIR